MHTRRHSSASSDGEDMGYDVSGTGAPTLQDGVTAAPGHNDATALSSPAQPHPPIAHFSNFIGYDRKRETESLTAKRSGGESSDDDDDESNSSMPSMVKAAVGKPIQKSQGGAVSATPQFKPSNNPAAPGTSSLGRQQTTTAHGRQQPSSSIKGRSQQQQQSTSFKGDGASVDRSSTRSRNDASTKTLGARRSNSHKSLRHRSRGDENTEVILLGSSFGSGAVGGVGATSSFRGSVHSSNRTKGQLHPAAGPPLVSSSSALVMMWSRGKLIQRDWFGAAYVGADRTSRNVLQGREIPCDAIPNLPTRFTLIKDEIAKMSTLSHENLSQYYGVDRVEDTLIVISEVNVGGRLLDIVHRCGRLDERTAAVYLYQVLRGLSYLHSCGFSHCNLKCSNVLVSAGGVVKLSDYGATLYLSHKVVGPSLHEGRESARWAAPEIVRGEGTTTSIDVWAVGCLTMELVLGVVPFEHLGALFTVLLTVGNPEVEMELPPECGLSEECMDFVLRCLRKHPASRPKASELLSHPFLATAATAAPSTASIASSSSVRRLMHEDVAVSTANPPAGGAPSDAASSILETQGSSTKTTGGSHSADVSVNTERSTSNATFQAAGRGRESPGLAVAAVITQVDPLTRELAELVAPTSPCGNKLPEVPVCAQRGSVYPLLPDPVTARRHQFVMLECACAVVACSPAHARQCANKIFNRAFQGRVAYLQHLQKRAAAENGGWGVGDDGKPGKAAAGGGGSGNSYPPSRSEGITSDGGYRVGTTSPSMAPTRSPGTPKWNDSGDESGADAERKGGSARSIFPGLRSVAGASRETVATTMSLRCRVRRGLMSSISKDNEGSASTHHRNINNGSRSGATGGAEDGWVTRNGVWIVGPTTWTTGSHEVCELEAASCVELAAAEMICKVELRRLGLFTKRGRPSFVLNDPPELLPRWWVEIYGGGGGGDDDDGGAQHRRPSSNRLQPPQQQNPPPAAPHSGYACEHGRKVRLAPGHGTVTSFHSAPSAAPSPSTPPNHHHAIIPIPNSGVQLVPSTSAHSSDDDYATASGRRQQPSSSLRSVHHLNLVREPDGVRTEGIASSTEGSIPNLVDLRSDDGGTGDAHCSPMEGSGRLLRNSASFHPLEVQSSGGSAAAFGAVVQTFVSSDLGHQFSGSVTVDNDITSTGTALVEGRLKTSVSGDPSGSHSPVDSNRGGGGVIPKRANSTTDAASLSYDRSKLIPRHDNRPRHGGAAQLPIRSHKARLYFLNSEVSTEMFVPMEMVVKLGEESSLHHFLPPAEEGRFTTKASNVIVGGLSTFFIVWTIVVVAVVLAFNYSPTADGEGRM